MDKHRRSQSRLPLVDKITFEEEVSELTDANKRLRRKIFDLYTIFEISVHLNSMSSSDQLLNGILLTCIGQMGVGGAAIMLSPGTFQEEHKSTKMPNDFSLELSCTKGLTYKGERFSFCPNRRLYHLMLSQKRPIYYADAVHALEMRQTEISKLNSLEAALIVPMILKNQLRGIMTLTNKISQADFQENDLEFLSILANQLTVAVDNSRLYLSEKEANLKLAAIQKQLVESEKMAALGKLSASIAHEINNPLGIIKNYLLLLKLDLEQNNNTLSSISIIQDEVNRISSIVGQLLDFYRPHKNVFQALNLEGLVKETVGIISRPFEQGGIKIMLNDFHNLSEVNGSFEQLRQVLINILLNAKDSMRDGGFINISSSRNGDFQSISISDCGSGIPKEHLPHIFEPFFTTKEVSNGTGLGLSVSYGIIKNHGGDITVRNNDERGATFTISLPLKDKVKEKSR